MRASDVDRENAVAFLKAHYADGRLAEHELAWRSDAAYRAVGIAELDRLTADLPAFARPQKRRRPRALPIAVLVLALVAWIVLVPLEVSIGLVLLVTAVGMVIAFTLAPVWIPVLLGFVAYRIFCATRRAAAPTRVGWR